MGNAGIRGIDWEPHHVLFEAGAWTSNSEAAKLRDNPSLIIPLYVAPHDELHRVVPYVPLLDSFQLFHVNADFRGKEKPLANVSELIRCLHRSIERFDREDTATDLNSIIRVKNGELAILAIQAQIPHISEGLFKRALRPRTKSTKVDRRRGGRVC